MVRASGGALRREEGWRTTEGHVWYELCKQLLKYVSRGCVCASAPEAPGDCLMEQMVAAGREEEQACCYRGRMACSGRGLLHLGPCHPLPHTPLPNTQRAAMPHKQKDARL
uniref:Uncharacterized protein n=1 Tax=Knipowitschia caucasica TaxID=637954 RepID=A0AAV2JJY7_KNICA